MISFVADVVLSLLLTFVSSRALLWITRAWSDSVVRLMRCMWRRLACARWLWDC